MGILSFLGGKNENFSGITRSLLAIRRKCYGNTAGTRMLGTVCVRRKSFIAEIKPKMFDNLSSARGCTPRVGDNSNKTVLRSARASILNIVRSV